MTRPLAGLIGRLPPPRSIRRRLVHLATEANYLRSLLRLVERRPRHASRGKAREARKATIPVMK